MEQRERHGTLEKALKLNLSHAIYGTFAEIGAGQEIAHWFFRAGGASGTVAKTMSAYDMTFSDEIYGKSERYVSRQRLGAMLDHEYQIVLDRLNAKIGDGTTFFVLADTVRSKGFKDKGAECHGWMGLRFQDTPRGAPNDIMLHVRLLDGEAALQADAMGILGVNLLYAAFHERAVLADFLGALMDDLNRWRVEIDMVKLTGPAFASPAFSDRLCALHLVQTGLTDAALFGPDGEILQAADALFNKPVFVLRGSFDPVTRVNIDMLERGEAAFARDFGADADGHEQILELTMHNLLSEGGAVRHEDFLARADVLQALGKKVLISKFAEFHRLSAYLARHTKRPIGTVLGLPLFEELFSDRWYGDLAGGLLEALGRLFRNRMRLYVYPMGDPATRQIHTARDARITPEQRHLLSYLLDSGSVRCIEDGLQECMFETSDDVRRMIHTGDSRWKQLVPEVVLRYGKWAAA